MPFAYDAVPDTLSYMSCANSPTNALPRAIYTFRIGSYADGSGLGFSPAIWPYMSTLKGSQRLKVLETMTQNVGTRVQLAIRNGQNLQIVSTINSGNPSLDLDYTNLLSTLDSQGIIQRVASLSSLTQRINYFSGTSGLDNRLLEGSLRFVNSESLAQSVRNNMQSGYLLTLTYNQASANPVAAMQVTGSPQNRAYGRGYNLVFAIDSANYSSADNRVLDQVNEVDLATGLTAGTNVGAWECLPEDRYMIVRATDWVANNLLCTPQSDEAMLSTDRPVREAKLNKIRRVLRNEDWFVDVVNQCIVAKPTQNLGPNNDACYGPLPNGYSIAYNNNIINAIDSFATCTQASAGTTICPHYVSVCTRR